MPVPSKITEYKLIAIIRGASPDHIMPIAEVLYEGGIRLLEITMNSAEPLKVIKQVAVKMGDRMMIGAGTVLDKEIAAAAVSAGARFILSPTLDEELIQATRKLGATSIPGAFTPTEIYRAFKAGADIVKVFPALSPSYIRDLKGPLPHIPLLPTGGITLGNISEFNRTGVVGFGIGSALVDTRQTVTDAYLRELKEKAKKFVEAVQ